MAIRNNGETASQQEERKTAAVPAGKGQRRPGRYIYIGPSLPAGRLKKNSVFIGGYEQTLHCLSDVLQHYPQVKKLLVPVEQLSAEKKRLASGGALSKAYAELAARGNAGERTKQE